MLCLGGVFLGVGDLVVSVSVGFIQFARVLDFIQFARVRFMSLGCRAARSTRSLTFRSRGWRRGHWLLLQHSRCFRLWYRGGRGRYFRLRHRGAHGGCLRLRQTRRNHSVSTHAHTHANTVTLLAHCVCLHTAHRTKSGSLSPRGTSNTARHAEFSHVWRKKSIAVKSASTPARKCAPHFVWECVLPKNPSTQNQ